MLLATHSEKNCCVITALHDTINSKLAIVRLVTSVTNPLFLPNIIFLALCFELFFFLNGGKLEKILYYTRFISILWHLFAL
jgi:hypothetical protein